MSRKNGCACFPQTIQLHWCKHAREKYEKPRGPFHGKLVGRHEGEQVKKSAEVAKILGRKSSCGWKQEQNVSNSLLFRKRH
jgi:hypothetical protein